MTRRAARPRGGWSGRLTAWLRGLLALAALAGLLAGIPAVLLASGADPSAVRLPTLDRVRQLLTSPDDGTLLIAVLRVVGWAGWAGFAISTVLETVATAAGWTTPALRGLAAVQRPAAYLVAAVAATLTAPAAAAAAAPAAHAAPAPRGQGATSPGAGCRQCGSAGTTRCGGSPNATSATAGAGRRSIGSTPAAGNPTGRA